MDLLFEVNTPLGVKVRITNTYWDYLIKIKHPAMRGREEIVQEILLSPDEIRRSRADEDVYLYYKEIGRLYCVVAKHLNAEGFLISAFPVDKLKEGERIWIR